MNTPPTEPGDGPPPRCDVIFCRREASYLVRGAIGGPFHCCREHYRWAHGMTRAPDEYEFVLPDPYPIGADDE